jgi:transposase-like protein
MATIAAELLTNESKRDGRGRRITSAARRAELVAGYRSSGLTMEQYAKQEGVKRHTLAKWVYLQDQRGGGKVVTFAEVKVPTRAQWAFELALPNGWVVRAADAAALAQLMAVAAR